MSGIVQMSDGYGWSATGIENTDWKLARDENGYYLEALTDSGALVKLIYVDEQKISPVYIFWQCRVYATSGASNITYTVANMVYGNVTSETIAIGSDDSVLITVEGYTLADVTVTFEGNAGTDDFKIYPMNETGI